MFDIWLSCRSFKSLRISDELSVRVFEELEDDDSDDEYDVSVKVGGVEGKLEVVFSGMATWV